MDAFDLDPMDSFLNMGFLDFVSRVNDPRVVNRCRHRLFDIVVITFCSMICGAGSFVEIAEFGRFRQPWFKRFLSLPNGIPSHDTFMRVLSLIDPKEFEAAFFVWIRENFQKNLHNKDISIDGKSLAGTIPNMYHRPVHMLEIYCGTDNMVLGALKASGSGMGEVNSVEEAIMFLNLKGALVTADAANSFPKIASLLRERKADYLFPIKGNQRISLNELEFLFANANGLKFDRAISYDRNHGRRELRCLLTIDARHATQELHNKFPHLKTLIRIERTRIIPDPRRAVRENDELGRTNYVPNPQTEKTFEQIVYYISSRQLTAQEAMEKIRGHWRIENNLHWVLDVAFQEDQWTVRQKIAAANLAVIRRAAFNVIAKDQSKASKRVKMKRAAWQSDYLESLLVNFASK